MLSFSDDTATASLDVSKECVTSEGGLESPEFNLTTKKCYSAATCVLSASLDQIEIKILSLSCVRLTGPNKCFILFKKTSRLFNLNIPAFSHLDVFTVRHLSLTCVARYTVDLLK